MNSGMKLHSKVTRVIILSTGFTRRLEEPQGNHETKLQLPKFSLSTNLVYGEAGVRQ